MWYDLVAKEGIFTSVQTLGAWDVHLERVTVERRSGYRMSALQKWETENWYEE